MKCTCGSDWFLEEKLVRPAGLPVYPQYFPLPHAAPPVIRYRCVECGVEFGKELQREANPSAAEAETPKPQPKRRGRPPKAAQN